MTATKMFVVKCECEAFALESHLIIIRIEPD